MEHGRGLQPSGLLHMPPRGHDAPLAMLSRPVSNARNHEFPPLLSPQQQRQQQQQQQWQSQQQQQQHAQLLQAQQWQQAQMWRGSEAVHGVAVEEDVSMESAEAAVALPQMGTPLGMMRQQQ